jgi:hypothetical protein
MDIKRGGSRPSTKGPADGSTPCFRDRNRRALLARASRSSRARERHGIRIPLAKL